MTTGRQRKTAQRLYVVVDSPRVACPEDGETQENNNAEEEQPQQIEDNQINERRPQRERRPPDWFVDYQMNS